MALDGLSEARQALALLARHAGEAAKSGAAAAPGQGREPDLERLAGEYQALSRIAAQNCVALKVGGRLAPQSFSEALVLGLWEVDLEQVSNAQLNPDLPSEPQERTCLGWLAPVGSNLFFHGAVVVHYLLCNCKSSEDELVICACRCCLMLQLQTMRRPGWKVLVCRSSRTWRAKPMVSHLQPLGLALQQRRAHMEMHPCHRVAQKTLRESSWVLLQLRGRHMRGSWMATLSSGIIPNMPTTLCYA